MRRQRGIATTLILYALAAVAVITALWWAVSAIESRGYDRGMAECARAAQEQRDREAKQAAGASTKLEAGNANAKVVYRTIQRQVDRYIDRPVYRNVCLDADGLRDANAALRGTLAAASKPDSGLPGPDAARGRDRSVSAPETD